MSIPKRKFCGIKRMSLSEPKVHNEVVLFKSTYLTGLNKDAWKHGV